MSAELRQKYPSQQEFYSKYPDVYKNWKYYYASLFHCVFYLCTFALIYHQCAADRTDYFLLFCSSWISGWSIFGLISIGHDACHKSLFPHQSAVGNVLNQLFSWLFVDCLVVSNFEWSRLHWDHDHFGIIGTGIPSKYYGSTGILHGFYDVLTMDLRRIIYRRQGWKRLIPAMCIRYTLWFYCGLVPFVLNTLTALIWMHIFFNIPHVDASSYVARAEHRSNIMITICQQTWDFFPGSQLMSLLSFGLNAHATHHCFPTVPRALHGEAAGCLEHHVSVHYHKCDSVELYVRIATQYVYLYLELCGFNTHGKWRRSSRRNKVGLL